MAATGLSADPKEYRARLAEQPDDQIDAWAAELMRDVAIRRGVIRVLRTSGRRRGSTSRVSSGCSRPAADRPRRSAGTPQGRLMVPAITLWALVPGDPLAGPRRPRAADRVPHRELPRARLRLTGRRAAGTPRPDEVGRAPAAARRHRGPQAHRIDRGPRRLLRLRRSALARLVHPFPSLLDGAVVAVVAAVAGGSIAEAVRLGRLDDRCSSSRSGRRTTWWTRPRTRARATSRSRRAP